MWEISQLLRVEKQHCLSGNLPAGDSPDAKLYLAQIGEANARKAETLAICEKVTPLLKIRALLTRGNLLQADRILNETQARSSDPQERVELLLEDARLASFRGDYEAAAVKSSTALDLQPSPTTVLTLLQVRALAFFELGDWASALRDLDSAESFLSVLPKAESGFYAKILLIKLIARTQGSDTALKQFKKLWDAQEWSLDSLLTLLRLKIDLNRCSGIDEAELPLACLMIARQLGDRLYAGLALQDLYYALPDSQAALLAPLLEPAKAEFARIRMLSDEADAVDGATSTTGLGLREQNARRAAHLPLRQLDLDARCVFLSRSERVIHLESSARIESVKGKMAEALRSLIESPEQSKSSFFSTLWGKQKYCARLHDGLIWNLLSRLRKTSTIDVVVENERIALRTSVIQVSL